MRFLLRLLLLGGLLLLMAASAVAAPAGPEVDEAAAPAGCQASTTSSAPAACPARLRLSGRIEGQDLILSWPGSSAVTYNIYYSSAPHVGYVQIDSVRGSEYAEKLAHISDVVINDYYRLQEKGKENDSNRLGVFTFPLVPRR